MDSIFNTPAGIGGKPHVFVRLEGRYALDEPNGSNRDQIILVSIGGIVFFGRVKQKEKNSGNPTDRRLSRDVEGKWCTTTESPEKFV